MAFSLSSIKKGKNGSAPWFIFDETNEQLITSPTIPMTVEDRKSVIFAQSAVAGLNYTPLNPAMNGNNIVSFTIPILNRRGSQGNMPVLAGLEELRNQATGFTNPFDNRTGQFLRNPTVIYYWGTHRPPLRYKVLNCGFSHQSSLSNQLGGSQYTLVDIELALDEGNGLYKMYELERHIAAKLGMIQGIKQLGGGPI